MIWPVTKPRPRRTCSFNYALLDDPETVLLGCVYIDPPEKQGADAEISWWVVDDQAGTSLERALDALVPRWIAAGWPFAAPRYVGRDLSWADWLALPRFDPPGAPVAAPLTPANNSHGGTLPAARSLSGNSGPLKAGGSISVRRSAPFAKAACALMP